MIEPALAADASGAGDRHVDRRADYSLLLFVSGASSSSARAIRHVSTLCEERLAGHYELTVVDVRLEAALARRLRVLATPTLMRQSPPPELRRVGDFSDHAAVLAALGILAPSSA